MVIDSSRFGNAPETLSKTAVSGSRWSVLPSDLNAAPTSASGVRRTVPITWSLLPLMTVTRPSRPSSAPSLCVNGRGSFAGFSARNCVTKTLLPSALIAMPCGLTPTFSIVSMTSSRRVLITETVSDDWLATYSLRPSGVSAQPNGSVPTLMVSITCFS